MEQARNAWTHRLTAAISGTIPRLGHFRVAMPGMLLQPARVGFIQIGSICKWFCGIHFNGLDKLMNREDCTHHAHFWIFFGSVISDTGFILAQKCSLSRFQANVGLLAAECQNVSAQHHGWGLCLCSILESWELLVGKKTWCLPSCWPPQI
jgi:hypothetical protein